MSEEIYRITNYLTPSEVREIVENLKNQTNQELTTPELYAEVHLLRPGTEPRTIESVFGPVQVKFPERFRRILG